jgi:4-carboxymuconolactone decarboxylase
MARAVRARGAGRDMVCRALAELPAVRRAKTAPAPRPLSRRQAPGVSKTGRIGAAGPSMDYHPAQEDPMARLPDPLDILTPEAKQIYDKISAKRGAVRGPFASLMHHPALAEKVADLGEYLRFGSTLPGDVRELAILITARSVRQGYEWIAHARAARRENLAEEIIERVRTGGDLSTLAPRYARPARVVQHVLAYESIPAALQAEVQEELGVTGLMELVVLAGQYRMIAGVLFAFDTPLPEGERAPF